MLDRDSWILLADDRFQELQSRDFCDVGFILAAASVRFHLVRSKWLLVMAGHDLWSP